MSVSGFSLAGGDGGCVHGLSVVWCARSGRERCSVFLVATLARHRARLGDACQSSKMAKLLNKLSFVFNISFLPKYRVKYYDYI